MGKVKNFFKKAKKVIIAIGVILATIFTTIAIIFLKISNKKEKNDDSLKKKKDDLKNKKEKLDEGENISVNNSDVDDWYDEYQSKRKTKND